MKKYEELTEALAHMASIDLTFAEKYNNPSKTHEEMSKYIDFRVGVMADEMHKESKEKRICLRIDDEEIIGFAVHYYVESNEAIEEEMKNPSNSKDQVMAYVSKLTEEQKAEITDNAMRRIMKAEEDKIVNASLGRNSVEERAKPQPKPKPKENDNQLSLF